MIQAELEKGTIGFVEVPMDAEQFELELNNDLYYKKQFMGILTLHLKALPKGNWQILGLSTELTEEVLKDIMSKYSKAKYFDYVNDYTHYYETAIKSFNSLKQSLGVFDVNKYGIEKPTFSYEFGEDGTSDVMLDSAQDDFDFKSIQWHQEQSKVRKYITLFKPKN